MVLGWYQYSTSSQSGDKKPKFRPRLQGGVGRLVMEFSCFYLGGTQLNCTSLDFARPWSIPRINKIEVLSGLKNCLRALDV